ncbi:hypothetical protein PHMEG_00041720 [Phytophthora megakarya]|uniref:Transcription activator GCR1-like domain-containing protein n=1 Tax=Phytophthora megakarya TaxID=4795 RepID=A0A225UB60_9STRA|nr:hypothetical protein PHMEG_00041720 [Phytophthora megakarya]
MSGTLCVSRILGPSIERSASAILQQHTDQISSNEPQRLATPISPTICKGVRMSRQIDTVTAAWQEWSIGFLAKPPVKEMEKAFGTQWRKNNTDTQYFYRRKPLYEAIELAKLEEPHVDEREIVADFEGRRQKTKLRRFTEQVKVALVSYKAQDSIHNFRQYFKSL